MLTFSGLFYTTWDIKLFLSFYMNHIETTKKVIREELNSNITPELLIVEKGNMVFTPPLVEHCMKIPEDTLFLTLSRNPRDQETYELDVIRTNLIDSSNSISWKPGD